MCTAVLIGWDSATPPPPPPPNWDSYTRALLVSKDRRHLFVTPWVGAKHCRGGWGSGGEGVETTENKIRAPLVYLDTQSDCHLRRYCTHCLHSYTPIPTYSVSQFSSAIQSQIVMIIWNFISILKGQCHEFFCFWFFSWISFPPAPVYPITTVSIFFAEIFASQGAPPVSTTPAAILPPVSAYFPSKPTPWKAPPLFPQKGNCHPLSLSI